MPCLVSLILVSGLLLFLILGLPDELPGKIKLFRRFKIVSRHLHISNSFSHFSRYVGRVPNAVSNSRTKRISTATSRAST